jgi:preprotein translocase subunit SecG
MNTFLLVLHVFACIVLVFVVLIQSGKDGGIGMMAGGSSQTVFGSSGGANFFTKFTSVTAAIFMVTSIFLTVTKGGKRTSIFDRPVSANTSTSTIPTPAASPVTAAPAAPAQAPAADAQKH